MLAAGRSLFTTRPSTLAGAVAVLRYVESQADNDDTDNATCPTYLPEEVDGTVLAACILREHRRCEEAEIGRNVAEQIDIFRIAMEEMVSFERALSQVAAASYGTRLLYQNFLLPERNRYTENSSIRSSACWNRWPYCCPKRR
jgi:hypothetical protein